MPKIRQNKHDILEKAFYDGDIEKVYFLVGGIPEHAKRTISTIVEKCNGDPERFTPLTAAVLYGNYHLCEFLIQSGVHVGREAEWKPCPLACALEIKHTEIILLLIRSGAVKDTTLTGKSHPLYVAIQNRSPPMIIEEMLLAGLPINEPLLKPEKLTAIQLAARENNFEAAKILVKYKADLNAVNFLRESALHFAVKYNYQPMAEFLIKNGADINNRSAVMSALMVAIRMDSPKMVKLLLDMGVSITLGWSSLEEFPPFLYSLCSFNLDIIKLIYEKLTDITCRVPYSNESALHIVASYNSSKHTGERRTSLQMKISKMLITKGAEVNAKDFDGRTPLDTAIYMGITPLCKLLLMEGADISEFGCIGRIPVFSHRFEYIIRSTDFKCPELVELCLERGADYNYCNTHYHVTPFHFAMVKHSPKIVKVFWKYGCPFDLPGIDGILSNQLGYIPDLKDKKLLEIQSKFIDGIKSGDIELLKKALEKGAEPRGGSREIPSPLHFVAASGQYEIAQLLLEKGVPVSRIDKQGRTPLHLAIQNKSVQTCQTLLQFGACYQCPKSQKVKSIKILAKEDKSIYGLFKNVSRMFGLVKKGDEVVLTILNHLISSGKTEQYQALMNCVNRKGFTLIGTAVTCGYSSLANKLMMLKIQHNDLII